MKKIKEQFCIDNYAFKVVKMKVFNVDNSINLNYYLLIDDDCFIHDYKIEIIEKLCIRTKTTQAHEYTKRKDIALMRRRQLIDKLNLKHEFGSGRKEITCISDTSVINEINKWMWIQDWKDITFQNIEYIFYGSNPSGQGNGHGSFKTRVKGDDYSFGFLFQCLNISKKIATKYKNVDYSLIWLEFQQNKDYIDFERFLNHNTTIENYLMLFKFSSNNLQWKEHKEELKVQLEKRSKSFIDLENKICKYRNIFIKNIEEMYIHDVNAKDNINQYLYKSYFNINPEECATKYEKTHIKPVWLIKRECQKEDNHKLLNQISDPFNFLPLPKTVHDLYDKYYFYWDSDGHLKTLKNLQEHEIKNFMKIDSKKLCNETRSYLNEYIEKVINKLV